jgi:magnesium transporter
MTMQSKQKGYKKTISTLKKLVEKNKGKSVRKIISKIHPADLAEVFPLFSEEEQLFLFKQLDIDMAGEVLDASNESIQKSLISNSNHYFIAAVLEKLYTDEAVDILSTLSIENAEKIISLMESEDAREVKELMFYEPYTAGRVMTLDFISIDQEKTAREAIEMTQNTEHAEMSTYVFVVDEAGRLVGRLSFQKLVFADPGCRIKELVREEAHPVTTDTDQEEAVRLVRKYDLLAIPVVDKDNVLKGIITVDDIMEILKEENSEDFYRLAGSAETDPVSESIFKKVGLRLPWLFITLVGGIGCSYVMDSFDETLNKILAVAFFTPLILALAGNISIQSSTIMVRGLATGEISSDYPLLIILKEIYTGLIMGILFGLASGLVATFMQNSVRFGIIIFISLSISILVAAAYGTLIPILCNKIKIDPAIASGPFVLIVTDVSALVIYLAMSTQMIGLIE